MTIKWTQALMVPTEWACLCPICGHETAIEYVEATGDRDRGEVVYAVEERLGDRWIRCDECDSGLEIEAAVVLQSKNGGR